jgi:hypothetical protein
MNNKQIEDSIKILLILILYCVVGGAFGLMFYLAF